MVGVLEVVLTGEKLSKMGFNKGQAKGHYAFSKNRRFKKRAPSYKTEFAYDPLMRQSTSCFKTFSKARRFGSNGFKNDTPGPGAYENALPKRNKSISFGIGRSVSLQEAKDEFLF